MAATSLKWRLGRAQAVTLALLVFLCAAAWQHMSLEAEALVATGICQCLGMQMSGPDLTHWQAKTLLPLFLMWTEMMLAMMLPSAAPMILTFLGTGRLGRNGGRWGTALFAAGYLAVWTLYSGAAALAQWYLHERAVLSSDMVLRNHYFSAALLVLAGLFQWSPYKRACLLKCRSPLTFIMTRWRAGRAGALRMGIEHGSYCAGCCAVLMLLLFVAGVMNLWWIAFLTLLVFIEKLAPNGPLIAKSAGAAFVIWGVLLCLV